MFEPLVGIVALVHGVLTGAAVLAVSNDGHAPERISPPWQSERIGSARRRLATHIERAGWNESPERIAVLALALSGGLAAIGLSTAIVLDAATAISLAAAGAMAGAAAIVYALRAAAMQRRRRATHELAPSTQLSHIQPSGGGS